MTNDIRLADDLVLSPEAVTDTFAILGIRGSGKTNTAVDLAEGMIRSNNVVAIHDPLDVWWGLKSGADGESEGLPVIVFGGRHADVPLEAESGAIIARWLMRARHPIVMSTKHLSHGGQARFVTDFALELYRHNDEPIHVILDEIARICPQNLAGRPDLARCVGAVVDLGSEGRASGIGTTLIGQRAARVNKDALTQAHTLIAMATVSAQDRKAIAEWIGENGDESARKAMMADIASLPRGTGYFYAPRDGVFRKVAFRARETFDSSATPKVGQRRAEARVFAKVDLSSLTAEIAATVEQAKADDPRVLRARIAKGRYAAALAGVALAGVALVSTARMVRRYDPILTISAVCEPGTALLTWRLLDTLVRLSQPPVSGRWCGPLGGEA